jgi:hypothetical protein
MTRIGNIIFKTGKLNRDNREPAGPAKAPMSPAEFLEKNEVTEAEADRCHGFGTKPPGLQQAQPGVTLQHVGVIRARVAGARPSRSLQGTLRASVVDDR